MKTYIERAAVETMLENAQIITDGEYCGYCTEDVSLDSIPAADVVEVRHGRWLKRSDGTPYCSNCGANERDTYSSVVNECAFCYSCGARMDKEAEYEAD